MLIRAPAEDEPALPVPAPTTNKRPLIEEIESKTFVVEPTYQISSSTDLIQVTIELPLVENFSEIDLQVSKRELKLEVEGIYRLKKCLN